MSQSSQKDAFGFLYDTITFKPSTTAFEYTSDSASVSFVVMVFWTCTNRGQVYPG